MESAHTPQELETKLGADIKMLRLQKNIDRKTLCARAGISVGALTHLEEGQGATMKTLIRVVRALDRQSWLEGIAPQVTVNPLHMLRDARVRKRASRRRAPKK